MVADPDKYMHGCAGPEKLEPHQRRLSKIKRGLLEPQPLLLQRRFLVRGRKTAQVGQIEREPDRGVDFAHGTSSHIEKGCAQGLVPFKNHP